MSGVTPFVVRLSAVDREAEFHSLNAEPGPEDWTALCPALSTNGGASASLHFPNTHPQEPMHRVCDQSPGVQVEESLSGVQAENLPRGLTSGVSDSCSSCWATDGCSGLSPMARLPGRERACPSCPAARVTLAGISYLLSLGQPSATSWVFTWTCQGSRCVDTGTQRSFLTPRVDGSGALGAGAGVLGLPPHLEGPSAQDPQKKCSDGLTLQNCPQCGGAGGVWIPGLRDVVVGAAQAQVFP